MHEQVFQAAFAIDNDQEQPQFGVVDPVPVGERRPLRLNRGLFTSLTPEWPTPRGVFDMLNRRYHFTLDACASPGNATCERYFTKEQDGLRQEWTGTIFLNPPYGAEIGRWLRKAVTSAQSGATVVCLVPARTDTAWWHDYCMQGEVFFVRGRLHFGDGKGPAPFPSAVVVFEPDITTEERARR